MSMQRALCKPTKPPVISAFSDVAPSTPRNEDSCIFSIAASSSVIEHAVVQSGPSVPQERIPTRIACKVCQGLEECVSLPIEDAIAGTLLRFRSSKPSLRTHWF